MKTKRYLLIMAMSVALLNLSFAAKTTAAKTTPQKPYPTGCKQVGYGFANGVLVLTPYHKNIDQKQVIYFIQNISKQEIVFSDQRDGNTPYIMHNDNTLKPDQWGVYAADVTTKFMCSNKDKTQTLQSIVDCENTVKVCEYANVKFAPNNRGNYWATTDMSMSGAVTEIIHQGVLLKS